MQTNDLENELDPNIDWVKFKENNINESKALLEDIKNDLSYFDTINLLTHVTKLANFLFENEDITQRNISFTLRELPIVHFLCGLSLHEGRQVSGEKINAEALFNLINKSSTYLFKSSPLMNNSDGVETEKNYLLSGHKQTMTMIRPINPERYHHQTKMYINYIDSRIAQIFVDKCGLSPKDFVLIGELINKYIINRVNLFAKKVIDSVKVKLFLEKPESDFELMSALEGKSDEEQSEFLDFYTRYLSSLETQEALLFTCDDLINSDFFRGIDVDKIKLYLSLYSSKQGDQAVEKNLLIENVLSIKPIMDWGGVYFCPVPTDLISSLPPFLEKLLDSEKLSSPPTRIFDRYQKSKGYFVEDKAEEFLLRIFPEKSVLKNVIYEFNGNVEEVDILVPYDNKLIIIQAKSGSLNNAARRGAERALKKAVQKLVEDAYNQSVRVRDFVSTAPNVVFKFGSNKDIAFVVDEELRMNMEYIFVNLTLEPLGSLAARIKDLRSIDLFDNNEYPISMSIYDFDTITSILPESPSILFHYFKERISSQSEALFVFQDELTQLGWYLDNLSIKKPLSIDSNDITHLYIDPDYLNQFDEYYLLNKEKPKINIQEDWLNLLVHIDRMTFAGRVDVIGKLLSIPFEMRERIINRCSSVYKDSVTYKSRGKKGDIGVVAQANAEDNIGVTFVTYDVPSKTLNEIVETYSLLRKYQSKKTQWIGLARQPNLKKQWWEINYVKYYDFPWAFDGNYHGVRNDFYRDF